MYLIWIRRVARIWKKGGGAFLKEWDNCKTPWPEFSLLLNHIHKVYPKLRLIFRLKSEIQTLFRPKTGDLQIKGLHWNWDVFFCRDRKFKRFFRPKTGDLRRIFRPRSEIHTILLAESRQQLHNFGTQIPSRGAVFSFSAKIGLKSTKNMRFCILYRPMGGGLGPPSPPPWLRYWYG